MCSWAETGTFGRIQAFFWCKHTGFSVGGRPIKGLKTAVSYAAYLLLAATSRPPSLPLPLSHTIPVAVQDPDWFMRVCTPLARPSVTIAPTFHR